MLCKVLEDMKNQTVWDTKSESVLRWINKGLSLEDIADGEGLSIDDVKKIAESMEAVRV